MKNFLLIFLPLVFLSFLCSFSQRQMEKLGRGLVAIKINEGVYLSWRITMDEYKNNVSYNIYRDGYRINSIPINSSSNFIDKNGTLKNRYQIAAVKDGKEISISESVGVWSKNYIEIPLKRPPGGYTPTGEYYTYSPNDCSVGDLDGDGEYEIIVKWDPSNSKDNSQSGYTGNVYIDAYKLDGTFLWRIDLGINIRAGAHYTQFLVYDFDGDGKAELMCKTAPGTKDGTGNFLSKGPAQFDNDYADYRNSDGRILSGPEYLTIFEGLTGREMATVNYIPQRGIVSNWGDSYGNRVDRFLACVAYLDGKKPSAVFQRGYYTRMVLAAWDWDGINLTNRWVFDSNDPGNSAAYGQGNHNLSVGDVDFDGKDEIIQGACAIDDDGKLMYATGLGHGDAMHLGDIDPDRQGLEVWVVHEDTNSPYGYELHCARTGNILWGNFTGTDNGRGLAADIDGTRRGKELWSASDSYVRTCKGIEINNIKPSINFRIYWDGDLQDELLDGTTISKWVGYGVNNLLQASVYGAIANNGSKANPCLSADILGDWREEVIFRHNDNTKLLLFISTITTEHKLYTLMHDPQYRLSIAWQNVGYNQPPHLSFYLPDKNNIPTAEYNYVPNICDKPLNEPWKQINIGDLYVKCCAKSIDESTIEVNGAGNIISGNSDNFYFVYRTLIGDGEIIARIENNNLDSTSARAGIMMRESLTPESKNVFLGIQKNKGLYTQIRFTDSSSTTSLKILDQDFYYWLKIKREGNTFTFYYSYDGIEWIKTKHNIQLDISKILYVGLAVNSNYSSKIRRVLFTNVSLNGTKSGNILVEKWNNIPGNTIESLINSPNFPNQPDEKFYLNSFESYSNDLDDNYGALVHGYLSPDKTGYYTFFVSSNANSELWLSDSEDPLLSKRIAYVTDYTLPRQWNKYSTQKSDSLFLEAGKKYYIKLIYKASTGEDYFSVAWKRYDTDTLIIDGKYLIPYDNFALNVKNKIDESSGYKIYPNPVRGNMIKVENMHNSLIRSIEIFDIKGLLIKRMLIENSDRINEVNIGNLKGLYILRIVSDNDVYITKIMIE